ncbi:hypothetical protein QJQ45_015902 [Haematococcus lacustris]|nr:hypothetical protein QJQ45_015902 [Haematococcus lacustris]
MFRGRAGGEVLDHLAESQIQPQATAPTCSQVLHGSRVFPSAAHCSAQAPQALTYLDVSVATMTSSGSKAVIKNADMSEEMQADSIDCATQALEKFNIEKDIAAFIKKEFDKKYNPTWHCIVGRNFGSYVTHETKHFIYFYLGQCPHC